MQPLTIRRICKKAGEYIACTHAFALLHSHMVTQGIGLSIDMGYDAGLRMQQLSKRGGMVVRDAVVAVNSERWICKCICGASNLA